MPLEGEWAQQHFYQFILSLTNFTVEAFSSQFEKLYENISFNEILVAPILFKITKGLLEPLVRVQFSKANVLFCGVVPVITVWPKVLDRLFTRKIP